MKFEYKKECNIRIGQRLYGIIALTSATYYGVYGIEVACIDWNEEHIIFNVN